MPTEVVHSIKASGGDYTTLEAWRDAQMRDLVAANEIEVAEIYDDFGANGLFVQNFEFYPTGHTWVVDSSHYVKLRAAAGNGWDGDTTKGARLYFNSKWNQMFKDSKSLNNIHFENLRLGKLISDTGYDIFMRNTGTFYVDRCYLHGGGYQLAYLDRGTPAFTCCLFNRYGYDSGHASDVACVRLWHYNGATKFINCTFVSNGTQARRSIYVDGSSIPGTVIKNCVAYGFDTEGYHAGHFNAANCTNNAAYDASTNTPPGSNPLLTDVTDADFADAANDDYHLSTGSILRGAGANLSADYPGMLDMDGDVFPSSGAWDIGADSYAAAAGADLAGAAQSAASAAGTLTTQIPLAGAALSAATAAGTLTTAIPLSGSAMVTSNANGTLSAQIALTGDAIAQAVAASGLTTAIPLSGDAGAQAGAGGDLTSGVGLAGTAQAVASGAADLTVQIRLNGAAIAEALALGALGTSGGGLSGTAQSVSSALGDLVTEIPLSGAALTASSADGALTTLIPLAGAAASVSSAVGSLDVALKLSSAALAQASASGDLTARITFDGASVSQAAASGVLSGGSYSPPLAPNLLRVAAFERYLKIRPIERELAA